MLAALPTPCTWALQNRDINYKATASSTHLASLPGDFKASSPSDVRHLRLLHELKSTIPLSYNDFNIIDEIPFFGTNDPDEYLEWECKMDDYLKLHQLPSKVQVKCATSTFHNYALIWWLHTPSRSFDMSWSKTKKTMQREFVPSTYTEHLQRQLENTIHGSKPIGDYFMDMKHAFQRSGVADPIWMKFQLMIGLNNT